MQTQPQEENTNNARRFAILAQILPLRMELAGCKSPDRRKELRAEINALRAKAVTP